MEAFKVGATLEIRDLAGPKLLELARIFDRLDTAANRLNKTMKLTSGARAEFSAIGKSARALQKDLQLADTNMRKFAGNMSGMKATGPIGALKGMSGELQRAKSFGADLTLELKAISAENAGLRSVERTFERMATHLTTASMRAGTLHSHMQGIITAGGAMPPLPPLPRGGGGGGGRGRGPGGGHGGGGLHGGGAHIGPGGIGLSGVGIGMAADLMVPLAVGYAAYSAVASLAQAAGEFQTEVARFKGLGLGDKMNSDAVKFVRGMDTIGTSLTENMVLFKDAQTVFRDSGTLDHAKMVTPLLSDMKFATEALYGKEAAAGTEAKFMDMLRVIELRKGLNNTSEFRNQANMIYQVLSTSGGRVDATQYLNMIKTGGVAAKSLSNKAIYYELEPIIQEMGGNRVGTALMSSYSNLVLGRLAKTSAAELMRLDLLDKSGVVFNQMGSIKQIKPGALKGTDMLQSSPVDYLEKVLLPAFTAKGITKESDVLREIGMIFSNRTASNLFSTIYQQLPTIRKGEEMSAKALNIDQGKTLADHTYAGKQLEFEAAWSSFKTVFGESVLPGAIQVLTAGTSLFKQLAAAQHNQDYINEYVAAQPTFWGRLKATWNWANGHNPDGSGAAVPNPVATPTSPNTIVHVPVHLDGRVIADVVSGHQARALSAPLGSGMFDPGMQQTPQTLKRW